LKSVPQSGDESPHSKSGLCLILAGKIPFTGKSIPMEGQSIDYVNPTSRAMGRMTTILFRPFDLGKWFVLGFTAWLAGLMEGGGSSGGGGGSPSGGSTGSGTGGEGAGDLKEELQEFIEPVKEYITENLHWILPLAIGLFLLVTAIIIVLLWVSSRGKFMFLDNVVHNRALVVEPWKRFKTLGNSLFWWRLVFSLIAIVILLGILGGAAWYLLTSFDWESGEPTVEWILSLVGAVLLFFAVCLVMAYILMLLEDFVIPVMYKHSLRVGAGWRRFLSLHGPRFWRFLLYALWKLLLWLAAGVMIVTLIIVTCCIAGCLMFIPYLGTVLLLPILVFFRALGPEFVRQFGDEFDLWEDEDSLISAI
jgi:hypothetical protein